MKRKLLISVYFILCSLCPHIATAQEQTPREKITDSIRISLLTCASGGEIYSLFGHTAIRYENFTRNIDAVFNYGMFNFNAPNFILRFALGETDYQLGATNYEHFVAEYNYLSYWSYAASISTLIVALAGPILGTLADYKDHKKKIFLTTAMLGALALACFWIPSSWLAFLVLFIAAKVAYSLSLIVYDSMLTDITTEDRMDAVSSKGYAWGYIGSVVPFIISLVFVLMYDKMGMTLKAAMMIAFVLNAVWWIAFTLPLVKY